MNKKIFLALLLVAAIALSGCALVVKDTEVDNARIVLDVNGETVTKGEFNDNVDSYLAYIASYYSYYGYTYDTTSASNRAEAVETVKDGLIEDMVKDQKIVSEGLELTEEEIQAVEEEAQATYDEYVAMFREIYFSDSEELSEEDQATLDSTVASYVGTVESLVSSGKSDKLEEKLKAFAVQDVTVSDEEVQADFDEKVAEEKASYEEDITAYGTAVNGGDTVYYAPAGYRYVKQVLVKFTSEDQTAISDAKTALSDAQSALTEAQDALGEEPTEEQTQAVADAEAKVAQAQADLDAATETAYANIAGRANEVYEKAIAGEDFAALIDEYNEDPGMTSEPGKTYGYAVCEGYTPFETAFVEGAMSLQNVGDVTEPIKSASYGYYIIRYESEIAEGAIDIETVREDIRAELLETAQDEAYDAAVEQWIAEANIKTNLDILDD